MSAAIEAAAASAPSASGIAASAPAVKLEQDEQQQQQQLDPMIDGIGPPDGEGSIRVIREEDSKFLLNHEGLRAIMDRAKKISNKVVVVSLVGDFRTGKSFLLNMFLRYLRYHESQLPVGSGSSGGVTGKEEHKTKTAEDTAAPEAPSPQTQEGAVVVKQEQLDEDDVADVLKPWMKFGGPRLVEGQPNSGVPGFYWEGGMVRRTHGIWMYARPFARVLPGTQETVAVLLMDTQGMFDFKTPPELTAAIFGLSTLVSSNQVYNIKFQIQEDKLQQLHYFTEFSRVALKEFEQAQSRSNEQQARLGRTHTLKRGSFDALDLQGGSAAAEDTAFPVASAAGVPASPVSRMSGLGRRAPQQMNATPTDLQAGPPFQHLQFLVRDWQNFSDEDDIPMCLKEMPEALDNAMVAKVDDQGTRAEIKSAFNLIKCFLLPHPGKAMAHKSFDGSLETIDPAFLRLVDIFIQRLFQEELVCKKIQGRYVTADSLYQYIEAYASVFRDGCLPKAMSLVRAMSTVSNLVGKEQSFAVYKARMAELTKDYLPTEELRASHQDASQLALESFDVNATFGSDDSIKEVRAELVKKIDQEYTEYVERNKIKMLGGLHKYVIVLMVCVTAWAVDRTTDYTCDAWSETCRDLSRLLAYVTYFALAALIWKFGTIYRQQGPTIAGMNALAVARGALQEMQDWREKIEAMLGIKSASAGAAAGSSAAGSVGDAAPGLARQPTLTRHNSLMQKKMQ